MPSKGQPKTRADLRDVDVSELVEENAQLLKPPTPKIDQTVVDLSRKKDGGVLRESVKPPLNEYHPSVGDPCTLHFTITLCSTDRRIYDSRVDDFDLKGDPVSMTVGAEENVQLFNLALPTIRSGETALITARAQYAWGPDGWKDIPVPVPANSDVRVEIELIGFDLGEDLTWEKSGQVKRSRQVEGDPLREGPKDSDVVDVRIVGRIGSNVFLQKETMKYELGKATEYDLPTGIDIALRRFEIGERALLWIGRKYCYGKDCNELYNIPEGSGINFDVTLHGIEKKSDQSFDSQKDQILQRNMFKAERMKERGNTLSKQGRYKEALKEYNQVIKMLESILPHLPIQGLVEGVHIRGITKQVQDAYWSTFKPKRDDLYVSSLLNSALCYIRLPDSGEAVRMCSTALKEQPNNIKALYRRGTAWAMQTDYDEAIRDLEKVLRLEKSDLQLIGKVEKDLEGLLQHRKRAQKAEEVSLMRRFGLDEHGKEINPKKEEE